MTSGGEWLGPRGLVRRLSGPEMPTFSFCSMVTRWDEYRANADTFSRGGFDDSCSEYLVVDNAERNTADGYVALNEFLQSAKGKYVVLCHQDVELLEDGRAELEERLLELTNLDPNWAVCGNAGLDGEGRFAICISHPYKERDIDGHLPARITSLDENFLVVRREANLALSRDLAGFHHYGTDLCIIADVLGWTCYVISFLLRHNSAGTVDGSFMNSRQAIMRKYQRAFRPRWIWVMASHPFYISGSSVRTFGVRLVRRMRSQIGLAPRVKRMDEKGRRR